MSNESSGVQVAIRVRKLISREVKACETVKWRVHGQSIWEADRNDSAYAFDKILTENVSNEETYEELAKDLVISAMGGINATIFAYGQTSSGKTHTMMGSQEDRGIIPRAVTEIFQYCAEHSEVRTFLLRVSYMEIYNETITDLLNPDKKEKLRVRENIRGAVYVKDLAEVLVTCEADIYSYLESGELCRHFAATNMNERSSRSHTIFRLVIESTDKGCEAVAEGQARVVRISQLNLVDLAGSERAKATGAEGMRLREGGHINTSLMVLSKVIAKLSEPNTNINVIPFRESKLTRILQSSLGGNAKTCVICTVTPAFVEESHSTLRFAKSAKLMKNKPIINEVMNDKAIILKYEKRIRLLERELEQKNQLESHIKLRDTEIMALKGQLVGAPPVPTSASKARRRETFFHGPQGLVPSPRNTFFKSRLTNEGEKDDIARQLFQLPAMVSDRGPRETSIDHKDRLEADAANLRSSLQHEQAKNAKLKNDLKELEEMCTEMGDRMQDHIDEQQEQIDQLAGQVEEMEGLGTCQKSKIQEMETILIAAGEERQDLLNQITNNEEKIRRGEERNTLILNEAEEQRLDLEAKLARLAADEGILSSPNKKRKASLSPIGYDPEVIDNLKTEIDTKNAEIARLDSLLQGSALETETRLADLQRSFEQEKARFQESQQQTTSGCETRISELEEQIRSLEDSSNQKNEEFAHLQRLVQEQADLVELATKQELSDLKTALEHSNTERLNLHKELETIQQDHSALLLKLQQTEERLETVKVETQLEKESVPMNEEPNNLLTELEHLKQQLLDKEIEITGLRSDQNVDDELREMVEERDRMIANLRSELEKTFTNKDDFEETQRGLNERISQLLRNVEEKSVELNEADDKVMHLQLATVDANLQIEQLTNDKGLMGKRNSELMEQNSTLALTISKLGEEKVALEEMQKLSENSLALTRDNSQVLARVLDVHGEDNIDNNQDEELQNRIAALTAESLGLQEENLSLSNRISELLAENQKLLDIVENSPVQQADSSDSGQLHDMKQQMLLLTEDNMELSEKIKGLEENTNLSESKAELTERINQLLENTLQLSDDHSSQVKDLNERLTAATSEISRLSTIIDDLTEDNTRLTERSAELSDSLVNSTESIREESQASLKEVRDLEKHICDLNEEVVRLNQQVATLSDERGVVEGSLAEAVEETQRLKRELEASLLNAEEAYKAKNGSESALAEMEIKVSRAEAEVSILKDCITEFSELVSEKEEKLTAINSKLEETEALLAETKTVANETEGKLNKSQHCLSELLEGGSEEAKLSTMQGQLNARISEVGSLETMVMSRETMLASKSAECDELRAEVKKFTGMIDSFQRKEVDEFALLEEKTLLEEEITSLKHQLDSHVAGIQDISKQLDDKTANVADLENQMCCKTAEFLRMQTEYEGKLVDLEKECTELRCKVSEEIRAKNALRSDCDELMISLQRKERAMKGKEEETQGMAQLEEEIGARDRDIAARDRDIAEKVQELQDCVGHIETMEEERQQLQGNITQMTGQISELEAKLSTFSNERDASMQQITNLQSQLDSLNSTKTNLSEELNKEISVMKEEILTLITAVADEGEKNKQLSLEIENLKSHVLIVTENRDREAKTVSELNSKLEEQAQKEAELSAQLATFSSEKDNRSTIAAEYDTMVKELAETKEHLQTKSEELARCELQVNELKSSKDGFIARKQVLEDQIEDLQRSILEYEMMKTSYIQLKSSFDTLQHQKNLVDAAKMEAEKDLSEYQQYFESTVNSEKAKHQQLNEKYNQLQNQLKSETESLKQDMIDVERELTTKISSLTSERNNLAVQVKEFSAKLHTTGQEVANLTEKQESLASKLRAESERCERLEARKIEDDKSYLEMYNKHQAMCNEADSIETKYNQLDTNFQTLKESLEKEIIRRKYVEKVAKVIPKTYNPTTLEDFMKGCETDHTGYLNRITNTYKDVGLVCQICEKRRKIDPNSPRYVSRDQVPRNSSVVEGEVRGNTSHDNQAAAAVPSQLENVNPGRQPQVISPVKVPDIPEIDKARYSPPQRKIPLKKPRQSEEECKQQ